ncbi:hypothetical protein VNO77_02538 [Canavalia gladiata]|uniref:Uncharacterized protein n=1 Tax=Canavalia gladiata TaxID=3824 RepID=A0AAN9MT39_CANGL
MAWHFRCCYREVKHIHALWCSNHDFQSLPWGPIPTPALHLHRISFEYKLIQVTGQRWDRVACNSINLGRVICNARPDFMYDVHGSSVALLRARPDMVGLKNGAFNLDPVQDPHGPNVHNVSMAQLRVASLT